MTDSDEGSDLREDIHHDLLLLGAITGLRHDEQVSRQGIMNHQITAHLMDLSFVRDATEMSIPESFAVAGLKASLE